MRCKCFARLIADWKECDYLAKVNIVDALVSSKRLVFYGSLRRGTEAGSGVVVSSCPHCSPPDSAPHSAPVSTLVLRARVFHAVDSPLERRQWRRPCNSATNSTVTRTTWRIINAGFGPESWRQEMINEPEFHWHFTLSVGTRRCTYVCPMSTFWLK